LATGRILRFDGVRGYGFIAPDTGGEDVFIHANDFLDDKGLLVPGARVDFDIEQGGRGLKASAVRLLGGRPAAAPRSAGSASRAAVSSDDEVMYDVLTDADFKLEVTEALLYGVPSLTGAQLLQVRERVMQLVESHNWVDS